MPRKALPKARNYTTAPAEEQQYFPPRRRLVKEIRRAQSRRKDEDGSKDKTTRQKKQRQETLTQMPDLFSTSSVERAQGQDAHRESCGPGSSHGRQPRSGWASDNKKQETLTQMPDIFVGPRRRMRLATGVDGDAESKSRPRVRKEAKKQRNTLTQMQFVQLGFVGDSDDEGDDLEYEEIPAQAMQKAELRHSTPIEDKPQGLISPRKRRRLESGVEEPVQTPRKRTSDMVPSSQSPVDSPISARGGTRSPLQPRSANMKIEPGSSLSGWPSPQYINWETKGDQKATKPVTTPKPPASSPTNAAVSLRQLGRNPTSPIKKPSPATRKDPSTRYIDRTLTIPDSESEDDSQTAPGTAAYPPTTSHPEPTRLRSRVTPLPTPQRIKTFSQATTIDVTQSTPRPGSTQLLASLPKSTQKPALAGSVSRSGAAQQSPPSSLRKALEFDLSSSPVETRHSGVEGHDGSGLYSRPILTDSQLLPDSIMCFELPKLPGWSQEIPE